MREAAAKLAAIVPRERLDAAVRAWAEAAPPRGIWGVAFSGGADSLALLLLIWAHWPERRRTLRVLHFNHRLRGAASRADAQFCARVCRELGVNFIGGEWKGIHRGASEAEARAARMDFFERHARVVWLGHQQDDIAESMLMRLARGSGASGLAAPRPVQPRPRGRVHLRPLLTLKKIEVIAALRAVGVTWREDASNAGDDFFRNRVRRAVVPAWVKASHRDAIMGAANSRALLDDDDAALEAWLDELDVLAPGPVLRFAPLSGKPRALWRRALHRWLLAEHRAGDISRAAFDTLLAIVECGEPTRQSIGRQGFAVSDGSVLRFSHRSAREAEKRRRAN